MGHVALVLGDQLTRDNPALPGADRVLLVESRAALRRIRRHRKRCHLVLSAMRHFADELRSEGIEVVEARDSDSLRTALQEHARGEEVRCATPHSAGVRRRLGGDNDDAPVRFAGWFHFLTDPDDFAAWARSRKVLRMEDFYRDQRRRHEVLLEDDGEPVGGRWNFDQENRRPPKDGLRAPDPWQPQEDAVDAQVRADLDAMGIALDGRDGLRLEAATATEAQLALDDFVTNRLAEFGPWQDAMVPGERTLFHARLAAPLNLGLLAPLDTVRAAEQAYRDGNAPIASVEGFVRQIVGWREYVWGMSWLRAEQWPQRNALDAHTPLPDAFWTGETDLACLHDALAGVLDHGYAHHIERLMVLGNVLLLTGVEPWQATRWFEGMFVDGAEWVMAPNAGGMALHSDGGEMMTKPYAAGGNYISKMSHHCKGCRYDPKRRTGADACPLTALYWDFIARHERRFDGNHRMAMPLRSLRRFDPAELAAVRARAQDAIAELAGDS